MEELRDVLLTSPCAGGRRSASAPRSSPPTQRSGDRWVVSSYPRFWLRFELGAHAGGDDPARRLAGSVRLGRAVRRVLGSLPADSTCLIESIVLVTLLERRGVETSLVIGVEPGDDFRAHAWVELMGEPLLPASQGVYERLTEL